MDILCLYNFKHNFFFGFSNKSLKLHMELSNLSVDNN